eukprot:Opistho-1_new@48700
MAWPKSGGACGASSISGLSGRSFKPQQETDMSIQRRSILAAAAAAAALVTGPVRAQGEDIVLGGSIPMTGVFAFAGIGINAGIQDDVKMVSDAGSIKGRKLRYVPEDTGYKVDASVAAFKKITSANKVH